MKEAILALAEKFACEAGNRIARLEVEFDKIELSEDIDTGLSGMLIFLVELYHHTGDRRLVDSLDKGAGLLIRLIKSKPSQNWSLFTGRAGSIYALLQVYFINKDKKLLVNILETIDSASKDLLTVESVSDFMYNGRTGTLLVLYGLYRNTGQGFLLPLINSFVGSLLDHALYTDQGLSWRQHEEISLRPSCGMMFGASGIKYVFSVMNADCRNKELDFVQKGITSYQNSCWLDGFGNWGNYERCIRSADELKRYTEAYRQGHVEIFEPQDDIFYQSGMTGIILANHTGGGSSAQNEKCLAALLEKLYHMDLSSLDTGLCNGLSGVGILLWIKRQEQDTSALLAKITITVFDKIRSNFNNGNTDLRLLNGDLGALYFLLKISSQVESRENILLPFFDTIFPVEVDSDIVSLVNGETRRKMLAKTFYRSLGILEVSMPDALKNYCSAKIHDHTDGDVFRFREYLEGIIPTLPSGSNTLLLNDAFTFEKKKHDFFSAEKRSQLQFYLDRLEIRDKSLEFLNQSDELILCCKIRVSKLFIILDTKYNWSFYKEMQHEKMSLETGQRNEYLLYYSTEMEKVEIQLNFMSIIIHQFDSPGFIGVVIEELKAMLQVLPLSILADYAAVVGSTTAKDFMNRIDYLLLTIIKQMVYDGFLETKNVTYEITI